MLAFDNLQIGYAGNLVVKSFSTTLKRGEIVALVGESGSGKTSVLRSAGGLLSPGGSIEGGDIFLEGESLVGLSEKKRQLMLGEKMAVIFQDTGAMLNPLRTIKSQYVEYIRAHRACSKKEAANLATQHLAELNLANADALMNMLPSEMSGGMRQRVGIAMAMTFSPDILLADEPTSALDALTQKHIVERLSALRTEKGAAILLVTHNLAVAAHLADRIIVMEQGVVVEEGPCAQVIAHPSHPYTKKLCAAVPQPKRKRYV